MHELALARSIVEVASAEAERVGAGRVRRLNCRIGELCQMDNRLIREAFDIAGRGTVCEDAELRLETTHARAICPKCRRRFVVRDWSWACPDCGVEGEQVEGGDEVELVSIEAEIVDQYDPGRDHVATKPDHGTHQSTRL